MARTETVRLDGGTIIHRIGGGAHPLADFYHTLMRASWPVTFGVIFLALIAINVLYALAYLGIGGIEGVRPSSFEDCFFFSVQTLATIGYGKMVPVTRVAHLVVTLEAFTGVFVTALTTGLLFAKFSRPTARVLFSDKVIIAPHDGKPTLMFRLANERSNRVMQASIRVSALRFTTTKEGEVMRRLLDVKLHRSESAMLAITWTVFHTIDESSPLYDATAESLTKEKLGLVATLVGLDDTISQSVHARHAWTHDQFLFNHRFVDVLSDNDDGSRNLDLRKFHDTVPIT